MLNTKTKKNNKKKNKNLQEKQKLWEQFDNETSNENKIECVYSKKETNVRENCDLCGSNLLYTDEGFLTCVKDTCGIIYKDILEFGAEWRFYGSEDNNSSDPTRCGMPINPLLKESSFGCKVICPTSSSYEMRKIRRYTEWQSMPYREKSQYDEFQKITALASQSGIPKLIIDDAMRFHKKVSEAKTFRGLNREGIIAASIYISARINNYPRTAKEIATIFNLDNTSATKGCKNAISILNEIENNNEGDKKIELCKTTPESFIDRYCSRLNISNELTKLAKFIAIRIQNNNFIPENTPHSIAAGIIYFISQECNLNISKNAINNISEISEVTINKCYKKLESIKLKLLPKQIIDKYNIT